jgi:peptidoglycan/xylan/chitin deacetylase (PgdA/CDA1 family)
MSKRELVARALDNPVARKLLPVGGEAKGLRILAYHRVLDDDPAEFALDQDLISASRRAFREQMKFARANFDVISFKDLHRCEVEGRPWPQRALIVTFDDGYRDNYTNAFPVLKELGIPATIFLATGHIGKQRLFWWDEIAWCVKQSRRQSITFPQISADTVPLASAADRREAIKKILAWIKDVPEEVRAEFVATLAARTDAPAPNGIASGMHLSWEEVKEMASARIEFGSHTVTHPILANVDDVQLKEEIAASKKTIERNLGEEALVFAYPVGRRARFGKRAEDAVARCGYRYAVSYDEGLATEDPAQRYVLPRIHVEREHSMSLFRANLIFPRLMIRELRTSSAGVKAEG